MQDKCLFSVKTGIKEHRECFLIKNKYVSNYKEQRLLDQYVCYSQLCRIVGQ